MADDKAAFGVFPQMKVKRSKQDREAAKNVPIDLARGALSGVLGAPGDIESLIRMLPGLSEETILPTSEDIEKRLPFRSETPVSQAATGLGQLAGGFYTGRGSPLRAIAAVPSAVKRAAKDFAEASAAGAPHVIKEKGGNWLTGSVEKAVEPLKQGLRNREYEALIRNNPDIPPERAQRFRESMQLSPEDQAINKWIESNLTNYIKKEMATPEDPVRKLAEKGIDPQGRFQYAPDRDLPTLEITREELGFPTKGMGQSPQAQNWEKIADETAQVETAGDIIAIAQSTDAMSRQKYQNILKENPWLLKVDPNTPVYSPKAGNWSYGDTGFDHIVDVLKEDLAAGRIRPEQLSKVSMEQAVRRTFEYDQEMAKKMREAQIKATEGMPVHKEYPEGYKWVELAVPNKLPEKFSVAEQNGRFNIVDATTGDPLLLGRGQTLTSFKTPEEAVNAYYKQNPKVLEEALKYEGDTMGHCVGNYCPDVLEGRSRIYSLRDAKGEPYVTVEVKPPRTYTSDEVIEMFPGGVTDALRKGGPNAVDEYVASKLTELNSGQQPKITQIKGSGKKDPSQAIRIPETGYPEAPDAYLLPYVQDFVKGGNWSDVADLRNTGLRDIEKTPALKKYLEERGIKTPRYLTEQEYGGYEGDFLLNQLKPPEGMKRGGVVMSDNPDTMMLELQEGRNAGGAVNISDNPDAMMMDVGDREFQVGGIVKRLARAPAKSKQEIEAIAERIAPQVTGEFVRKPKETQSVAGKTQKQFAREKELPVEFTDVKPVPKVEVLDPESLKGMVVTGVPGDPTVTGKSLVRVGDIKLDSPSPQHGGPLYGLGRNDDIFWASGIDPAGRVQTVAKEAMQAYDAPVAGQYIMMGPESINFAQHFADANLSAIDLSKMTKRQIEDFNKLIRFGNEKSGPRPSFPGIENKEDAYLHFAFDPALRKHFNEIMQMPTVTERFNLPSGQDIRFAITETPLRDLETGVTGFSMGRLAPEVPKSALPLSEHPTYSHDIPGRFMGGLKYPTPYELTFPDTLKSVMEHSTQRLAPFNSLKYVGPRQIYDQQMIDELKMYEEAMKRLTGKKEGGEVQKAGGGLLKKAAKAMKGTQEVLPAAEREANLQKFLAESKAPMRLYHGTTSTEGGKGQEAIRRIKPSKEGSLGSGVYLTPSTAHASGYSGSPNDEAISAMLESKYAADMGLEFLRNQQKGNVLPGQVGGNMIPVYAQLKNPLLIETKNNRDPMIEALIKLGVDENKASRMVERAYENKGYIGKEVETRARAAGYDGLMQFRDGELSEVVSYNPNAVKSAIGNKGTYDTSKPDLNEASGGLIRVKNKRKAKA